MGFWIFLLIIDLLIPIIMIIAGKSFLKAGPQEINHIYGYRTTMSMKNRDTWEFAHHYCGKIWFRSGWILLPVSILSLLFVMGKSADVIGTVGTIVSVVDMIVMILSIIPTENALKKTFDESGNRRRDHQYSSR